MSLYYVTLKDPFRIGETIKVVPTGKTRTTDGGRTQAEGRAITPGCGLETVWFTKEEIVIPTTD